jgi:mannobiose 2-epimerase
MVGYWDAFEISGEARFAQAAHRSWQFISQHHVDRQHGDWIKMLDAELRPLPSTPKAGPWECPYHHVRAELEMLSRLARHAPTAAAAPTNTIAAKLRKIFFIFRSH